MTLFLSVFASVFRSVFVIFLIAGIAGWMVRRKVVTAEHIRGLSVITINLLLPSLIFSKITGSLHPDSFPDWWKIPLIAVGTAGLGILLAWGFWRRELPQKRNMLPLTSLMNAAYFTLPVGLFLYPAEFDRFALYVSLYVLGISPLVWSFGKFFISDPAQNNGSWKGLITPPLIANLVGLFFVFSGFREYIPDFLKEAIDMLGQATSPVATIILGATIGGLSFKFSGWIRDISASLVIKLLLIPGLVFVVLLLSPSLRSNLLLSNLLLLEAASPAATALIIQIRKYGGDEEKAGSLLLWSYIVCLLTIPLWMASWAILN